MSNKINSQDNPNIYPGGVLESNNGRAVLEVEGNRLSVLFRYSGPITATDTVKLVWSPNTEGKSYDRLCMNWNGELCMFTNSGDQDTVWKSGSWDSGRPGPYELVMQDDGNLVIYASDNTAIWSTGTFVSPPPIEFSQVTFTNAGNGVACWPLVKSWDGSDTLWAGDAPNSFWGLSQGQSKTVNFDLDTVSDNLTTVGAHVGGDGTIVSLGLSVMWGNDDWVNPLSGSGYQFVYKQGSRQRVSVHKFGGLRDGDCDYDGAITLASL